VTQVASAVVLPVVLSDLVPNELRGRMAATYLLTVSIVGAGLSPTVVAMTTDYVFGAAGAVRYAMAVVAATCLTGAAAITWFGRGAYSKALPRSQRVTARSSQV
jgi:MFS family permease